MPDETSDADLIRIFDTTKVIAVVGASLNPTRASFSVGLFLADQGFKVVGVNPGHVGKILFGQPVVGSLADVPDADMVDIFKRSEAVGPVVDAALASLPGLKTVWMQLGIKNAAAADKARVAGVTAVQDRCPKIEILRLPWPY